MELCYWIATNPHVDQILIDKFSRRSVSRVSAVYLDSGDLIHQKDTKEKKKGNVKFRVSYRVVRYGDEIEVWENVVFVKERGDLCDLDWGNLSGDVQDEDFCKLSFTLLKLKSSAIGLLPDRMKEDICAKAIIRVDRFDLFVCGMVLLYRSEVRELPEWMDLLDSYMSPEGNANSRRRGSDFRNEIALKRSVEKLDELGGTRESDPELHMANERSFVRWSHVALYLLAIGGALMRENWGIVKYVGVVCVLYGTVLAVRATFQHRKRIKVLRKALSEESVDSAFLEIRGPQIYGGLVLLILLFLALAAFGNSYGDISDFFKRKRG
jgi:uncharacterized membrane protein YidH (DUF202 family)